MFVNTVLYTIIHLSLNGCRFPVQNLRSQVFPAKIFKSTTLSGEPQGPPKRFVIRRNRIPPPKLKETIPWGFGRMQTPEPLRSKQHEGGANEQSAHKHDHTRQKRYSSLPDNCCVLFCFLAKYRFPVSVYETEVLLMSRHMREKSSIDIYHVMLRGNNQQVIFEDTEDFRKFLYILSDCKEDCKFELYAYCLMSNHIHLLIR